MADLLTPDEHALMATLASAANQFGAIIRAGDTGQGTHDWAEVAADIHRLQQRVLAQAAGRAYPDQYRLLGGWPNGGPAEGQANPPEILVADHPVGSSIVGCAICTLRIRCGTWPEVEDAFRQLAEHHCVGDRVPDAGEPLILPCLICGQDNDVTIHWHCPRCDNSLGYDAEAIAAERQRRADREIVTEYLGEGALEVDVIEGPATATCSCGHHLNQHNGMTTHPDDGGVIASGYCVACPCRTFDPAVGRALLAEAVTPELYAELDAGVDAEMADPPDRDRERITPSYTEAEWTDVLAAWLATKRTTLIGRSWPATSPEERHVVAAELAGWIIEAAGEILE